MQLQLQTCYSRRSFDIKDKITEENKYPENISACYGGNKKTHWKATELILHSL